MSKHFWGIDIGRSALKAVKIEKHKGNRLEIVDLELIEFEVSEGEDVDRDEQIRDALGQLKQRKRLKASDPLFFSIPGHGTFNRTVSLPPVDAKQIPEMVKWEAQQQIPFPIDEVIWGWQKVETEEDFGEVEVNLFAVRKEIINNFMGTLESVGLDPKGIQIAPLALFNFITYDQQPEAALVAIDMGAEYSELIVVNGSRIWLRNLQIAGNDITKAIQSKFQIPFAEAEKLKIKAAKSKHANKIFQVMKPILKDLVGEIHRSVGFYKSQNQDVRFDKVLLLGNGTKLVGFKRFFRDNLQDYNIELLKGLSRLGVSRRVNVNLLEQNIASYGIAIGLAIQAAGEAHNNVVLIPEEKLQAEALNKKKPLYIIALVILAAAVVYKYTGSTALISGLEKLKKTPNQIEKQVKERKEQWTAAINWGNLTADVDRASQLEPARAAWTDTVTAVYSSIPRANSGKVGEEKLDMDKVAWLYQLRITSNYNEFRKEGDPAQGGKPTIIRQPVLRVRVLVCIPSPDQGAGGQLADTNKVNDLITAPMKARLEAVVKDKLKLDPALLKIEPLVNEYFRLDTRDPAAVKNQLDNPAGAQAGKYFFMPVTAEIPLAPKPETK